MDAGSMFYPHPKFYDNRPRKTWNQFTSGTPCLPDQTSRLSNNPNSKEQANGFLLVVD